VSDGLEVLLERGIIARKPEARSCFQLANFNPRGSSPQNAFTTESALARFQMSSFAARLNWSHSKSIFWQWRSATTTRTANLSYDKFGELAGIDRGRIRPALSVLTYTGLLHTERVSSRSANRHSW
jgi:hypothetical protein